MNKLTKDTVILREKIWIPLHLVKMKKVIKNYLISQFDEVACGLCEYKPDRPSYLCDSCQAFQGTTKLYSKLKIEGCPYVGIPIGDRLKALVKTGAPGWTFNNLDDRRTAPKLGLKDLKFTGTLKPVQVDLSNDWLDYEFGQLQAPPRTGKCQVAGTLVSTVKGLVAIEKLVGDIPLDTPIPKTLLVYTKDGLKVVSHVFKSKSKTIKITLASGHTVEGTPEHKMWVLGAESTGCDWKQLKDISREDKLVVHLSNGYWQHEDRRLTPKEQQRVQRLAVQVKTERVDLPNLVLTNKKAAQLFISGLVDSNMCISVFSLHTERQIQVLLAHLGVHSQHE